MTTSELAHRNLHLKLYPSPTSFAQRREVLRIISKYGEYHPVSPVGNAFLVIFKTTVAAQAVLNASPIRYRIISAHNSTGNENESSPSSDATTVGSNEQEFVLSISPTTFSHEKFLHSRVTNPLHDRFFPMLPRMSLIASALSRHIPHNTLSGTGLMDWDTGRGRGIQYVRNTGPTKTPRSMAAEIIKP
ncbi:putative pal1-like protein [Golovinomyces cichoracearum]|uniref:Putative pal1-like protein n=1 Tax=Golovinomyces cichoracearum TaxID=62708 RepID=A0A420IBY8_9PEZI|nr:putative pal1-like protein [Golovinomyces cichoracearum]